nr:unnamed protein product [Digitaria exilis]
MGWYEGPPDGFVHSLLVDLRETIWTLKREKTELKAALADAVLKLEQQRKEMKRMSQSGKCGMKRVWMFGFFVSSVVAAGVFCI